MSPSPLLPGEVAELPRRRASRGVLGPLAIGVLIGLSIAALVTVSVVASLTR